MEAGGKNALGYRVKGLLILCDCLIGFHKAGHKVNLSLTCLSKTISNEVIGLGGPCLLYCFSLIGQNKFTLQTSTEDMQAQGSPIQVYIDTRN